MMFDAMKAWFGALPRRWKFAGLALLLGFTVGGASAEGLQLLDQVTNNRSELRQVDDRLRDTRGEVNLISHRVQRLERKLDRVLCILDPAQAEFPLACERGGER